MYKSEQEFDESFLQEVDKIEKERNNGPATASNSNVQQSSSVATGGTVLQYRNNGSQPDANCYTILRHYFGHIQFRPCQWKIISLAMIEKRDQLVVMATGSGKSLCYQFPPVFMGGLAVVISPLISLMEDQVQNLNLSGIRACLLGSAQTSKQKTYEALFRKEFRIVYMTPEYIESEHGVALLRQLEETIGLTLIAVDEAHCISQWGHDFRASYRHLGIVRSEFPRIPFLAVTGTATPAVREDIVQNLRLFKPIVTCTSFDRPNLYLEVKNKTSASSDLQRLMQQRADGSLTFDGPTIVYCPTRKHAEDVHAVLSSLHIECGLYHAGMTLAQRKANHKRFSMNQSQVVVATIAFGMGIDKSNIRRIIHYGAPRDIESYYQEIGRAGRDGRDSICSVFYSENDFCLYSSLNEELRSERFRQHKTAMLHKMREVLVTQKCRRKLLLSHFGDGTDDVEKSQQNPLKCCDNCRKTLHPSVNAAFVSANAVLGPTKDFGDEAMKVFRAVKALNGQYGLNMVVNYLRGKRNQRMKSYWFEYDTFGTGQTRSDQWWKTLGAMLIVAGYLNQKRVEGGFGAVVSLSTAAEQWMKCSWNGIGRVLRLVMTTDMEELEAQSKARAEAAVEAKKKQRSQSRDAKKNHQAKIQADRATPIRRNISSSSLPNFDEYDDASTSSRRQRLTISHLQPDITRWTVKRRHVDVLLDEVL